MTPSFTETFKNKISWCKIPTGNKTITPSSPPKQVLQQYLNYSSQIVHLTNYKVRGSLNWDYRCVCIYDRSLFSN